MKHTIEFREEDRESFAQAVNYLGSRVRSLEWTLTLSVALLVFAYIYFGAGNGKSR